VVGWGIFLIVIGAGSLLLPLIGFQFRLMELLDPYQPYAGIVVAIVGAGLVFMGMNRKGSEAPESKVTGQARLSRDPNDAAPPREG
jgi:hypothetical protein